MRNELFEKILGAMYGVAVGDALGGPLENLTASQIKSKFGKVTEMIGGGWLNLEPGEVTDDTQMTIATALGITTRPSSPMLEVGRQYVQWYLSNPKDVGQTCASSIAAAMQYAADYNFPSIYDWRAASKRTDKTLGGRTAGNGSLMRTAYVGLYYPNEYLTASFSQAISYLTHHATEAAVACGAYGLILHRLSALQKGKNGKRIIAAIIDDAFREDNRVNFDWLTDPQYEPYPSGYVMDSLAAALHCIYTTDNFEDAIVKAVNLGGDADTIGAITGGIAGALYGYEQIPERWISALDQQVRGTLYDLCAKAADARIAGGRVR